MSLLFNMLSRLVIAFLPRSKCLLISWLQSSFAVIWEPPKIKSLTISTVSPSNCCVKWWDWMLWLFQNPALQGGLHFYGCAGSVGGLPQLAAVLSWPHLMLLGKRWPIFFGVQCFFFFPMFFETNIEWEGGGREDKGSTGPRGWWEFLFRKPPEKTGVSKGHTFKEAPATPHFEGTEPQGRFVLYHGLTPTRARAKTVYGTNYSFFLQS